MNISVVIPAYNAANTIGKAIDSCLNQSVPPKEIIVILDGCIDNTKAILDHKYPKVKQVVLDINQGVSHARNIGIKEAAGDWIAFLDADDEWHSEKLEVLAFYHHKVPSADFFFHEFSEVALHPIAMPPGLPVEKVKLTSYLLRNRAQSSCICMKSQAKVLFNEHFQYCEDHDFALNLIHSCEGNMIPYEMTLLGRPLLSVGGLSGNRWAMRRGEMKLYMRAWRLNVLYLPIIPFLVLFSLLKHLLKK